MFNNVAKSPPSTFKSNNAHEPGFFASSHPKLAATELQPAPPAAENTPTDQARSRRWSIRSSALVNSLTNSARSKYSAAPDRIARNTTRLSAILPTSNSRQPGTAPNADTDS